MNARSHLCCSQTELGRVKMVISWIQKKEKSLCQGSLALTEEIWMGHQHRKHSLFSFNSNQRHTQIRVYQITEMKSREQRQHRSREMYAHRLWRGKLEQLSAVIYSAVCFALLWFGLTYLPGIVYGAKDGTQGLAHWVTSPPLLREIFKPKNAYGLWTGNLIARNLIWHIWNSPL